VEGELRPEDADGDRKVGGDHLSGEELLDAVPVACRTVEGEAAARIEGRAEERQALDVIPMVVRQEDGAPRLALEGVAQRPQPAAHVEDEQLPARSDFDARGVAAVAGGVGTWGGDASPHSPERDRKLAHAGRRADPSMRGRAVARSSLHRRTRLQRIRAARGFTDEAENQLALLEASSASVGESSIMWPVRSTFVCR